MLTTSVENFPGFLDGIMGPELMAEMRAQAERFGARVPPGDVRAVDSRRARSESASDVDDGRSTARSLIIATGASARLLGPRVRARAHGPRRLDLRDLRRLLLPRPATSPSSAAATRRMEEAIFLTKFAETVTRRPPARRAARVEDHAGQGVREPEDRVRLGLDRDRDRRGHQGRGRRSQRNAWTGEDDARCRSPGVFVAIGHTPNTDALRRAARDGRRTATS